MSESSSPNHLDWRPFQVDVMPDGDVVRVRPYGEVDIATAPRVAAPLAELGSNGHRKVVLDLAEVTFIDSSGMRAVLDARQTASQHGVEFEVLPGPPNVQRAFQVAGLDGLLFA